MQNTPEHLDKIWERLDELDEAIRGNGKLGLNHRVQTLEDRWKEFSWMQRIILGLLIADLVQKILA